MINPDLIEELSDDELDALLAAFLGTAPEPEFTEKQSQVAYVGPDHTPVRITVEYQTGHAYEAAQATLAVGSPVTVATFIASFADESVDAKLAEAGLSREELRTRVSAAVDQDRELDTSRSALNDGDPLAIVRDGADVAALLV